MMRRASKQIGDIIVPLSTVLAMGEKKTDTHDSRSMISSPTRTTVSSLESHKLMLTKKLTPVNKIVSE